MGVRTWIEGWPVYRQLADGDVLGRGAAAKSPASAQRVARTASADKVVKSVCPYNCTEGRGGVGLRKPAADHRARPAVPGAVPQAVRNRVGAPGPGHGDGHDRRPGDPGQEPRLAVGAGRGPHPAHPRVRQPRRGGGRKGEAATAKGSRSPLTCSSPMTGRPPAAAGSTAGSTPTGSTKRPGASRAASRTGWPPNGAGPRRPTADPLQPGLRRSGRQAMERAQGAGLVGCRQGAVDRA